STAWRMRVTSLTITSGIDGAIEADGASAGVQKLSGGGAEGDRLPVRPVPQVGTALNAHAQTGFAAEEEAEGAWLLWRHRLQPQGGAIQVKDHEALVARSHEHFVARYGDIKGIKGRVTPDTPWLRRVAHIDHLQARNIIRHIGVVARHRHVP